MTTRWGGDGTARAEFQRIAHSHDSSTVRSKAAGLVVALDAFSELIEVRDPEEARRLAYVGALARKRAPL